MRATLATDGTLIFYCPGCDEHHGVPVDGSRGWKWNGSLEAPTIEPSILVRSTRYGPDRLSFGKYDGPHPPSESSQGVCHSYVREGRIEFLSDCTHTLAGQTVDLPDIKSGALLTLPARLSLLQKRTGIPVDKEQNRKAKEGRKDGV